MKYRVMVTTSWDDGHVLDLRLAALLQKYRIKGTFYVSPYDREFPAKLRLAPEQILELAKHFEIGAHTLTHPRLTRVTPEVAAHEIVGSKHELEAILGTKVTSFCYPGGQYNLEHAAMAREAKFLYGRTVERFFYQLSKDPLQNHTSTHAYRHWSDALAILTFARFQPKKFVSYLLNWDQLAIAQFEFVKTNGGIFHLWGHSWEIDNHHDWARLERVLSYISGDTSVKYVENRDLL